MTPTKDGWYWYLPTDDDEHEEDPAVLFLYDRDGAMMADLGIDGQVAIKDMPGQWKGPLHVHGESWTTERPTAGKWWVSLHPSRRRAVEPVAPVVIYQHKDEVGTDDGYLFGNLDDAMFSGALWLRRETPQDPFAKGET